MAERFIRTYQRYGTVIRCVSPQPLVGSGPGLLDSV